MLPPGQRTTPKEHWCQVKELVVTLREVLLTLPYPEVRRGVIMICPGGHAAQPPPRSLVPLFYSPCITKFLLVWTLGCYYKSANQKSQDQKGARATPCS